MSTHPMISDGGGDDVVSKQKLSSTGVVEESEERITSTLYATEIVKSLFGPTVGIVAADYSCYLHRYSGRLYAASNALCFYSNLFGFERRLRIQLRDVTELEKIRSSGVRIKTAEGDEHVFRSFQNRDAVLEVLLDLHGKLVSPQTPTSPGRGPLPSSSPTRKSQLEKRSHSFTAKPVTRRTEAKRSSSSVVPSDTPDSLGLSLGQVSSAAPSSEQKSVKRKSASEGGESGIESESIGDEVLSRVPKTATVKPAFPNEDAALEDMKSAWEDVKVSKEPPFIESTIKNLNVACDLETFFDKFISDDAPHSIESYQRDVVGDTDVVCSRWARDEGGFSYTRTLQFRHHVPSPLAPMVARGTKRQRCRRFGDHGICIESSTTVEDVPNADAFYVEDQWLIEQAGGGCVEFNARFQIHFTRSTLLRRVIESRTKAETHDWFTNYAEMVNACLDSRPQERENDAKTAEIVRQKPAGIELSPPLWGLVTDRIHVYLLSAVFVTAILVYQIVLLQARVRHLEGMLELSRVENMRVINELKEAMASLLVEGDNGDSQSCIKG